MFDTVTVNEAAKLAHASRGSIFHWIRTGRLAIDHRVGRIIKLRRADVLKSSTPQRIASLKETHLDLNLLTVREISRICCETEQWTYSAINELRLKRYYFDRWSYLVSGVELWEKAQGHHRYAQLLLKR
jgi:hypothetical protein